MIRHEIYRKKKYIYIYNVYRYTPVYKQDEIRRLFTGKILILRKKKIQVYFFVDLIERNILS